MRVVATPSAMNWVDADRTEKVTGFPVLIVAGDDGPEVVANPRYRR